MTLDPATSRTSGASGIVWVEATAAGLYTNGAADYGNGYGPVRVGLDTAAGRVWFEGCCNPGTDGEWLLLPVEMRPSVSRFLWYASEAGGSGMDILTTGVVDAFANPTGLIAVDGLSFTL